MKTAPNHHEPMEIVHDKDLTQPQKQSMLMRMAYDELRLTTSCYEGMDGGRQSNLERVMKALRQVSPEKIELADVALRGRLMLD